MGQCEDHLGSVKSCPVLREPNLIAHMVEQFTAVEEVCDKVKSLLRLESVVQFDDKWVSDLLHDVPFDFGVLNLVGFDDEIFL